VSGKNGILLLPLPQGCKSLAYFRLQENVSSHLATGTIVQTETDNENKGRIN
jgi:hypothetical protein